MASGEDRLDQMGDITFDGAVGKKIHQYGQAVQKLGHDLAAEFEEAARLSQRQMRKLKGHPALLGVDVYLRARRVSRHLRRASELSRGVSAEAVKFTLQYRREFLNIQDAGTKPKTNNRRTSHFGEVDL